mgnify:CR=1 FL=1
MKVIGLTGGIGSGIQTAALYTAGRDAGSSGDETESYNGSSWTAVTAMNTGRAGFAASTSGTQTAFLAAGGGPDTPAYTADTEKWNGTNWTEVNDLSTGIFGGWGSGIATSALLFGGKTPAPAFTTKAEFFNGTSWAETGSMGTAMTQPAGSVGGTGTTALQAGGDNADGYKNTTQEFTVAAAVKTVTDS